MNMLREIFRGVNGDLSSKRIMGSLLIISGIVIGYIIALTIDPRGELDESILFFIGTQLTAGMALLGVCVKEKKVTDFLQEEDGKNNC